MHCAAKRFSHREDRGMLPIHSDAAAISGRCLVSNGDTSRTTRARPRSAVPEAGSSASTRHS